MSEMEDKLGAILGNPDMMQKIMSMAQSLNQAQPQTDTRPQPQQETPAVNFDPAMLQRIAAMAGQTGIDRDQQALLNALSPYLSKHRIEKLEKAMRAAKLAGLASSALGNGGLQALLGR